MKTAIVELTNRCNLRCRHCFEERHAATGDLPLEVFESLLAQGKGCGLEHLSFTGGEPTVHRQFQRIVRRVSEAGYTFSFVSNGVTFPKIYPLLRDHAAAFKDVTFSLDGAREATHDQLRGAGSFRRVVRAATISMVKGIRFHFNMVLTARNRGEVGELVEFAAHLGASGVRFGHLMFNPEVADAELELSLAERRAVETEIWALREQARIPVGMAPGYYSDSPFFPCGPLEQQEFNVDYRGNVTLCCHLSGHSGLRHGADVAGNLATLSLADALEVLRERVARYIDDKRQAVRRGRFDDADHFPCWYCVKYLGRQHDPSKPFAWVAAPDPIRGAGIHVHAEP